LSGMKYSSSDTTTSTPQTSDVMSGTFQVTRLNHFMNRQTIFAQTMEIL
jgi:hypothetical protein